MKRKPGVVSQSGSYGLQDGLKVGGNQKSANSDRTSRPLPISIRHRSQKEPKEISACTCTRAFWPSLQKIGASRTVGGTRGIRPPRTTRVFTHEIRPDFGA